ncbi:hypothetical protein [Kineosporia sp. NBRC 101731]|uniref:hypothetical protein n=1 Tax=Kineosporia sp. NBRC 101731 TaxID=3032199 RepID=UPI002556F3E1|nr:hypothetical protein [Kineosporia sp. NBRC 101731]
MTATVAAGLTAAAATGTLRIASSLDPPSPVVPGQEPDHAYTTDTAEARALAQAGYLDETLRHPLYLFTQEVPSEESGRIARLRRFYNGPGQDHFYTPFEDEFLSVAHDEGYTDESADHPMWVLMADNEDDIPAGAQRLYRVFQPVWVDNFYTTSLAEAEAAVAGQGYEWRWTDRRYPCVFTSPAIGGGTPAARWHRLYNPPR